MSNEQGDGTWEDLSVEEFNKYVLAEEPSERIKEHSRHQNIDVTAANEYRYSQEEYHCNIKSYRTNWKMEPVNQASLEKKVQKVALIEIF